MQLTKKQEQTLVNILERFDDLQTAYLFGSQARGTAGPLSDIDLGVLFKCGLSKEAREKKRLKVFHQAALALGTDAVDMVDLENASVFLRYRVVTDGKLLVNKSEKDRRNFFFSSVKQYEDFRPYLAFQRQHIKRFFAV